MGAVDIRAAEKLITDAAEAAGGEVFKVGASNKSDSIYVNIRKPKTLTAGWNAKTQAWDGDLVPEEYAYARVRISNHHNATTSADVDLFINVIDSDDLEDAALDVFDFLENIEPEIV